MGNSIYGGGKMRSVKVMKITGETVKLKAPVKVEEVIREHPGFVVLESEAVKHYGVRAKPLEAHKELDTKRLYFLGELPKEDIIIGNYSQQLGRVPRRRVRSGINMSAKERLESLKLARRSVSDLSIINNNDDDEGMRVKVRLPKSQVE